MKPMNGCRRMTPTYGCRNWVLRCPLRQQISRLLLIQNDPVRSSFQPTKVRLSLVRLLKKLKITPNFAFFDEAHNTVNKETNGYLLLDKNLPIKKRLFMTATPRTVTGGATGMFRWMMLRFMVKSLMR